MYCHTFYVINSKKKIFFFCSFIIHSFFSFWCIVLTMSYVFSWFFCSSYPLIGSRNIPVSRQRGWAYVGVYVCVCGECFLYVCVRVPCFNVTRKRVTSFSFNWQIVELLHSEEWGFPPFFHLEEETQDFFDVNKMFCGTENLFKMKNNFVYIWNGTFSNIR